MLGSCGRFVEHQVFNLIVGAEGRGSLGFLDSFLDPSCGSELARDSGGSVNEDVGCAGLVVSKLAPTGNAENAGKYGDHFYDSDLIRITAPQLSLCFCSLIPDNRAPVSARALPVGVFRLVLVGCK